MKPLAFLACLLIPLSLHADVIKMSRTSICHDQSSPSYERTKQFMPFDSIDQCLSAGGRLPKNQSKSVVISQASYVSQPAPVNTGSANGNTSNQSFNKAKKILEREVYPENRVTFYCQAKFDANKNVIWPEGFSSGTYQSRAKRVEWEHIVPAENFGRTFAEWRDGHTECVDSKGESFKGRKCAEKMNTEYRFMQSDMFNLVPAIGSVNALRQNYNFAQLSSGEQSDFGSCPMKVSNRKVEPPEYTRGAIARTYMYMESVYPRYKMSKQQRQLMSAWDKEYPVTEWECDRTAKIAELQGNGNMIVGVRCGEAGYW